MIFAKIRQNTLSVESKFDPFFTVFIKQDCARKLFEWLGNKDVKPEDLTDIAIQRLKGKDLR